MGSEPHSTRRSPGGGWWVAAWFIPEYGLLPRRRQAEPGYGVPGCRGMPGHCVVVHAASMLWGKPLGLACSALQRGNQGPDPIGCWSDAHWRQPGEPSSAKQKELKLRVSAVASSCAQHSTSASMVAPGAAPRPAVAPVVAVMHRFWCCVCHIKIVVPFIISGLFVI